MIIIYYLLYLALSSGVPTNVSLREIPGTDDPIQPYTKNPRYWQYKGEPILLIGGTDNDNLFQNTNLEGHLDSLHAAGGNYVRNTMSDRDPGDLKAFKKLNNGKYDLDQWNTDYWEKFEQLLDLTHDREIIVQIEIWDRFDHSQSYWQNDPYNPKNNINYTYEESGFQPQYDDHPNLNKQPFFFTVPALNDNKLVLSYQQRFIDKLLSIALHYDHILYCIDNETSADEAWPTYWNDYIKDKAGNTSIQTTEMWDAWDISDEMHKRTYDHPNRYSFIDISQNTHTKDFENWQNAQLIFDYTSTDPRPINSTKIYGNDLGKWAARYGRGTEHAIHSFFRNLLGGFASSRFHRPPSGIGLSGPSIAAMKTIRQIEKHVKFWDIVPRMDLLFDNEKNEAYLAADEGIHYLLFFPKDGEVILDLSNYQNSFSVRWIDANTAQWIGETTLNVTQSTTLKPPTDTGCLALIVKS